MTLPPHSLALRPAAVGSSGQSVAVLGVFDPYGWVLPALLAVALAVVHVGAGHLTSTEGFLRNRLLSLSAGASVAYVFVHVLPEIARYSQIVSSETLPLSHHVYVVTLLGFVAYYGLERAVRCSAPIPDNLIRHGVFWLHVAAFGVYNALIGYLLFHREAPGLNSLLLYAGAMALHFLVIDYGLWAHHRQVYDDRGRWALAASVLVGAAVGGLTELPRSLLGVLFAFLAGAIILNVIKEELPAERDSRFWSFAVGAGAYAVMLLFV